MIWVGYLQLEDLVKSMDAPCIMDMKLGTKSYEPTANAEKIAIESRKFPLQSTLGFRLQGMKVFCNETNSYQNFDKAYCRSLQSMEDLKVGLRQYFSNGSSDTVGQRRHLIPHVRYVSTNLIHHHHNFILKHNNRFTNVIEIRSSSSV
jgi:hypothetical protein